MRNLFLTIVNKSLRTTEIARLMESVSEETLVTEEETAAVENVPTTTQPEYTKMPKWKRQKLWKEKQKQTQAN